MVSDRTLPVGRQSMPAPTTGRGGKRRRWVRRFLIALILGTALYAFRVPILQGIGGYLVVEEPSAAADYVLIMDGDRRYARAAELYHSGFAPAILLIDRRPG